MSAVRRVLELLREPNANLDRLSAVVGSLGGKYQRPGGMDLLTAEQMVVDVFDNMAAGIALPSSPEDIITHVFGTLGFHGNTQDYYDPKNSIIQHVLRRRTGIPLTLAIVAIELGRRADIPLNPVGMPGHFLIGDGSAEDRFFDPFAGGRLLGLTDCQAIYEQLVKGQGFDANMLRPVNTVSIVARMLQNLRVVYLRQGDVAHLAAVLEVRIELPGASTADRLEYSNILGALGRFDQAAAQRDRLVELDADQADQHVAAAARHRARRN